MPISLCTMSRTVRVKNSQGELGKILPFGTLHKCSTPSQPTQPQHLCYFPLVALHNTEEKERALFSHSLHCSERGLQCPAQPTANIKMWPGSHPTLTGWLWLVASVIGNAFLPSSAEWHWKVSGQNWQVGGKIRIRNLANKCVWEQSSRKLRRTSVWWKEQWSFSIPVYINSKY